MHPYIVIPFDDDDNDNGSYILPDQKYIGCIHSKFRHSLQEELQMCWSFRKYESIPVNVITPVWI